MGDSHFSGPLEEPLLLQGAPGWSWGGTVDSGS
jgi:hypothetical protein